MNIEIAQGALDIMDKLSAQGFEAYVVGGCVRDSLLGKTPQDWDICTDALPEQVKNCFSSRNYKIIETGIQHGTLTILLDREPFEVTTYRTDGEYLDNRRPSEVKFISSLREDLARRDFTINAMAYSKEEGLQDYFGGQEDLQRKLIRCVGEPDQRFLEDALRIMRALRLASVFGFEIAKTTASSIVRHKELLRKIAPERIQGELCKLLCGDGVDHILKDYYEVMGVFIPELLPMVGFQQFNPHHCYDVWEHTVQSIISAPADPVIRLTMLFHDMGKPRCFERGEDGIGHFYGHGRISTDIAMDVLKRLRFNNETMKQIKELVLFHDGALLPKCRQIKRWLNKIGEGRLRQLLQVKRADTLGQSDLDREERLANLKKVERCIDEVIEKQQCFSLKDLAVNGKELIATGIPQGAEVGAILNKLMDMVIEEQVDNDKEQLLCIAKAYAVSKKAHEGQKDKGGSDYFKHPLAVADLVTGWDKKTVALLHDIIEDTDLTLDDLKQQGFSDDILSVVEHMTRRSEEHYDDYFERLITNKTAAAVKMADLIHNSQISRIANPTQQDLDRIQKYMQKIEYLKSKEEF